MKQRPLGLPKRRRVVKYTGKLEISQTGVRFSEARQSPFPLHWTLDTRHPTPSQGPDNAPGPDSACLPFAPVTLTEPPVRGPPLAPARYPPPSSLFALFSLLSKPIEIPFCFTCLRFLSRTHSRGAWASSGGPLASFVGCVGQQKTPRGENLCSGTRRTRANGSVRPPVLEIDGRSRSIDRRAVMRHGAAPFAPIRNCAYSPHTTHQKTRAHAQQPSKPTFRAPS